MFGIGRTSTQTTLASIESTKRRTSSESQRIPIKSCYNEEILPPSVRTDLGAMSEQVNNVDKLSTISEANSRAARSRPTSEVLPLAVSPLRQKNESIKPGPDSAPQVSTEGTNKPPKMPLESFKYGEPTSVSRGDAVKQWARKRLFGRSRELRIPGLGLQVHIQITHKPSQKARTAFQTTTDTPVSTRGGSNINLDVTSTLIDSNNANQDRRTLQTPPAVLRTSENSVPSPVHYGASKNREYLPENLQQNPMTKQERILIKRKTETLKRKAAEQPKCECTEGCHCLKESQRSSFASNDRRTCLIRDSDIPPHILGPLLAPSESSNESHNAPPLGGVSDLAGLGSHLSTERSMSSSAENSSTVAESSRAPSRLSQTTAVDGTPASAYRRPLSSGRSSSMPGLESLGQGSHYQDLLQHSHLTQFNRLEADAQRSSTRNYERDDLNASEGTESSQRTRDFIAGYVSPATRAHLPLHDQEEMQTPIDGPSRPPPSTHTIVSGESQELTPRPSSFHGQGAAPSQPTQAAPEILSSALQGVLVDGVPNGESVPDPNLHSASDDST